MPLVTVKTKYQVTLPTAVRRQAKLAVGDILEAKVKGKKITLTPKSLLDRELAVALEDVRKGRVVGPFDSAGAMLTDLQKRAVQHQKRKKRAKTA
jgi:AbrB family looped-hinge helix DNA binding protein